MMNTIKVGFSKEISFKEDGNIIYPKDFNKRGQRLLFIDEYFDTTNNVISEGSYTAIELTKEGEYYIAEPVYIYTDGEDKILSIVPLEKAFEDRFDNVYFTYWKDLMRNFIGEIAEYVNYEVHSLIAFLKNLIENNPNQLYYYADGNNNKFYFEVLDQFEFTGELTQGMCNENVIISNIKLIDKYEENVIVELPWVQIDGMIDFGDEDEDQIQYTLASLLHSFTTDDMKGYILETIEKLSNVNA